MIHITDHAKKRLKQRLGLPKSAWQRHAQRAFERGLTVWDAKGNAKNYLENLFLLHNSANQICLYGAFAYVFNDGSLITVLHAPKKLI